MILKRLVAALALIVFAAGICQAKVFSSAEGEVSITLPKTWTKAKEKDSKVILGLQSGSAHIQVRPEPTLNSEADMKKKILADYQIITSKKNRKKFQISDPAQVLDTNKKGGVVYYLDFSTKDKHFRNGYFTFGDTVFSIATWNLPDEKYEDILATLAISAKKKEPAEAAAPAPQDAPSMPSGSVAPISSGQTSSPSLEQTIRQTAAGNPPPALAGKLPPGTSGFLAALLQGGMYNEAQPVSGWTPTDDGIVEFNTDGTLRKRISDGNTIFVRQDGAMVLISKGNRPVDTASPDVVQAYLNKTAATTCPNNECTVSPAQPVRLANTWPAYWTDLTYAKMNITKSLLLVNANGTYFIVASENLAKGDVEAFIGGARLAGAQAAGVSASTDTATPGTQPMTPGQTQKSPKQTESIPLWMLGAALLVVVAIIALLMKSIMRKRAAAREAAQQENQGQ